MTFYFENAENIPFHTREFQKNKFCASFPLYFLRVFLVSANLVSEYEQSLISSHIGSAGRKRKSLQRGKEESAGGSARVAMVKSVLLPAPALPLGQGVPALLDQLERHCLAPDGTLVSKPAYLDLLQVGLLMILSCSNNYPCALLRIWRGFLKVVSRLFF
jgi:hypothetical protein